MLNQTRTLKSLWSVRRPKVTEATVLLAAAWLVPVLVHLIPWHGERPLGVYLLPVFWTALVAVQVYGLGFALLVGLVTPVINLALTGLPALGRIGPMALEVTVFVGVAAVLARKAPWSFLAGPLAYAAGKAVTIGVQWLVPAFEYHRPPLEHWLCSLQNGLAGLLVLLAINLGFALWAQRGGDWEKE